MSNAILFGAGASFGSNNTFCPPLGDDLFKALQDYNSPGWGALPSSLAIEFRGDFEKGMEKLSHLHPHNMPILQRAMAGYFFNFEPTENNLYHILAQRIKKSGWKGTITTLNYERLLELSLLHGGITPIVGRKAYLADQIEMCLPHGCCHLFSEGIKALSGGVSFSGVGVTWDNPLKAVGSKQEFNNRIEKDAVPPAMSYFEPQKTTTTGISFIKNQRERWTQITEESDIIAIIGLKVRDVDKHIWDSLKNTTAKLIYCSGSNAGEEFVEWCEEYRQGKEHVMLPDYFDTEFNRICLELGISTES